MTPTAEHRILDRVRRGLQSGHFPDASSTVTHVRTATASVDTLVEPFIAALTALGGQVARVASEREVAATIVACVDHEPPGPFLSWDDGALACPGAVEGLLARGWTRLSYDVPADTPARQTTLAALGSVALGITGADAALADSGAAVLVAGPGRGRLVSLLPPIHVLIVPVTRLYANIGALLAARPGLLDEASNTVAIAGPSRTADIEMTLTHGVHGPKRLHAILVG